MNAIELLAFCRQHAASIYVRVERRCCPWEGAHCTNPPRWLPMSELTPVEVLENVERWLLLGHTPVRVLEGGRGQS